MDTFLGPTFPDVWLKNVNEMLKKFKFKLAHFSCFPRKNHTKKFLRATKY